MPIRSMATGLNKVIYKHASALLDLDFLLYCGHIPSSLALSDGGLHSLFQQA